MPKSAVTPKPPTTFANLFARLASLPVPSQLRGDPPPDERERRALLSAYCRLTRTPAQRVNSWIFDLIHRRAAEWINLLLAGEPVSPGSDAPRVTWVLADGDAVRDLYPEAQETLLGELATLLHQRPFPFRRCRRCGRVFVRSGKALDCSAVACRRETRKLQDRTNAERQKRWRVKHDR